MKKIIESFDGTKIFYEVHRVPKSKYFLVLLHGTGGHLSSWKKETEAFHKKGISTLALDFRGHGLSGRPRRAEDYKLESFAKDVKFVLDNEEIKDFVLVGHSLGGIIATVFAKLYPKMAKAYIFVNSFYISPKLNYIIKDQNRIRSVLNYFLESEFFDKSGGAHPRVKKNQLSDLDLRRIYSDVSNTSLRSWLFVYQHIADFDGKKILPKIKQPVLIVKGERDFLVGDDIPEKMHLMIKKSKIVRFSEGNHLIPLKEPLVLSKEIYNFLNRGGIK